MVVRDFLVLGVQNFQFTMEAIGYLAIVTSLTASALAYLIAREGAFRRFRTHRRVPRAELERHFDESAPAITLLIPSYAEEPGVVRTTLLSAALQEFPDLHIVLLLDDNPNARGEDAARTRRTITVVDEIRKMLEEPQRYTSNALAAYEQRFGDTRDDERVGSDDILQVSAAYAWSANWLEAFAAAEPVDDHVSVFFVEQVIGKLADELRQTAVALNAAARDGATELTSQRLRQLYNRLVWTFTAELSIFQRKAWASLSHEANKAMNLNSYMSLMGRTFGIQRTSDGPALVAPRAGLETISFPDTEFLLTLDADSMLLREYCLRLVYFLQQPENSRVAVTQTPYSSYRGARTRIERLAAATTDVQHILHQGMTAHNATFWVGANAVIRKAALDDIVEIDHSSGFEVRRYIQDHTVIEDTESSIDIATHGWTLVNYPERLSYSATPPDFGSLVVQRRRWANGGLLILPSLFSQARERKQKGERVKASEFLLRLNYTASIAWSSFALVFLLAYPFDNRLLSWLVVATALPYFMSMSSDLHYCGYKWSDVVRIYGFNLILLPVNLAGVFKSLQQAVTAKKIPFARTPKVKNRTATPVLYLLAPAAIVLFSIYSGWRSYLHQDWGTEAFAILNGALAGYAILSYIGVGPFIVDLWLGATHWMWVEVTTERHELSDTEIAADWRSVLYKGAGENAHAVGYAPVPRDPAPTRAPATAGDLLDPAAANPQLASAAIRDQAA